MRPVILFIATSLDGHIARKNGDIDWLFTDQDYGYEDFYNRIDTVVMGRKTYEVVCTFGDYPYPGKNSVVFSHTLQSKTVNGITFTQTDATQWLKEEKSKPGKAIWLVGGAGLMRHFWQADLIDEMIISIHPHILGQGISLFEPPLREMEWELGEVRPFKTGLVQIQYLRKLTDSLSQPAQLLLSRPG